MWETAIQQGSSTLGLNAAYCKEEFNPLLISGSQRETSCFPRPPPNPTDRNSGWEGENTFHVCRMIELKDN